MKSMLIKTIDYSVFDKWNNSIRESAPILVTVSKVEKKQYFLLVLSLMEYSLDENNNANVVYDLKITRPDKSIYHEQKELNAVKGHISDPQFLLADATPKICFEPEDEFGTYKIVLKVKDLINGETQLIEDKINLVKFANKKYFKNDKQFTEWIYNYYVEPSPEKAISAFYYWIKSPIRQKRNSIPPYFCFFIEIFNENKHLSSHIMDMFDSLDLNSKFLTLTLLHQVKHDFTNFFGSLKDNELELYEKVLNDNYDFDAFAGFLEADSVEEFLNINVHRLDMLWGTFFASGKYDCIKEISKRLEFAELIPFTEEFKGIKDPTEEDRKKYIIGAITLSAFNSLQGNCKKYLQVLNYCICLYKREKLTEIVKSGLNEVLAGYTKSNFNYNM